MHLIITPELQARIAKELSSLPIVMGKAILTMELNYGSGGKLSGVKFKRFSEDEWRPSPS